MDSPSSRKRFRSRSSPRRYDYRHNDAGANWNRRDVTRRHDHGHHRREDQRLVAQQERRPSSSRPSSTTRQDEEGRRGDGKRTRDWNGDGRRPRHQQQHFNERNAHRRRDDDNYGNQRSSYDERWRSAGGGGHRSSRRISREPQQVSSSNALTHQRFIFGERPCGRRDGEKEEEDCSRRRFDHNTNYEERRRSKQQEGNKKEERASSSLPDGPEYDERGRKIRHYIDIRPGDRMFPIDDKKGERGEGNNDNNKEGRATSTPTNTSMMPPPLVVERVVGEGTYSRVAQVRTTPTTTASSSSASSQPMGLQQQQKYAVKIFRGERRYYDAAADERRVLDALMDADPEGIQGGFVPYCGSFWHEGTSAAAAASSSSASASKRQRERKRFFCLVFPLQGPSLYHIIKRNGHRGFPLYLVRDIAYQLIRSLAFVHSRGIIHTDVKPENVLFSSRESAPSRVLACPTRAKTTFREGDDSLSASRSRSASRSSSFSSSSSSSSSSSYDVPPSRTNTSEKAEVNNLKKRNDDHQRNKEEPGDDANQKGIDHTEQTAAPPTKRRRTESKTNPQHQKKEAPPYAVPVHSEIKLIDLGCGIFAHRDLLTMQHQQKQRQEQKPTDNNNNNKDQTSQNSIRECFRRTDRQNTTIQTRHYRAPEVVLHSPRWSFPADVWSVGCLIAELVTGDLLFPFHEDEDHLEAIFRLLERPSGEEFDRVFAPSASSSDNIVGKRGDRLDDDSKLKQRKEKEKKKIPTCRLLVDSTARSEPVRVRQPPSSKSLQDTSSSQQDPIVGFSESVMAEHDKERRKIDWRFMNKQCPPLPSTSSSTGDGETLNDTTTASAKGKDDDEDNDELASGVSGAFMDSVNAIFGVGSLLLTSPPTKGKAQKDRQAQQKQRRNAGLHHWIRKEATFPLSAADEEQLFDLLGGLLALDPRRRLTMEEALKHPFFQTV